MPDDVFTMQDALRAVALLETHNAAAVDGFYVCRVHPRNLGALIAMSMEENTARKWARSERSLRLRGGNNGARPR